MTVWVVDNRVPENRVPENRVPENRAEEGGLKASMTERLIGVLGEWYPSSRTVRTVEEALQIDSGVVVLSGSSLSVLSAAVPQAATVAVTLALQRNVPVLGICFGFQLLARMHGVPVAELGQKVRERRVVESVGEVYFHHEDGVFGGAGGSPCTMLQFGPNVWGVQFHPEATPDGQRWLKHWLKQWLPKNLRCGKGGKNLNNNIK